MNVDLRKCEKGDVLISIHGTVLIYVKPLEESNYYDHEVEYAEEGLGNGSRTHDGYVFRKNRWDSDHDIALILKEHIGEVLEFEYNGKKDADFITSALMNALKSGKFKNCRIKSN
ncbi:MAG: hypothetical protein R3243_16470 [Arenibacter latericius]|nr:hypothetical protein [Arenibacter latericius]